MVSAGGNFELGFFDAGNSKNRYVGIWLKRAPISSGVVWVANRENPLNGTDGVLKINSEGDLTLVNQMESVVWFSNSTKKTQSPVVAQLLNTGNLVLKEQNDNNPDRYLWQSFDYPGNMLLPGMKLGWNLKTGLNRLLSSWKTSSDASSGAFKFGIDLHGVPQLMLWQGNDLLFRAGYWNGVRFPGFTNMNPNPNFHCNFISNEEEVYFMLAINNQSSVGNVLTLNQSGRPDFGTWNDRTRNWFSYTVSSLDQCLYYNSCGAYGSCNVSNAPLICQCLDRFEPRSPEDWKSMNWTRGCIRKTPYECKKGDGFRKFSGIKVPDTKNAVLNLNMGLTECEGECLRNCSCTAYALANIKEGYGCLLWFGDLVDIRTYPLNGQEIFVRMAASDSDYRKGRSNGKRRSVLLVTCIPLLLVLGVLFLIAVKCIMKRSKRNKIGKESIEETSNELELPLLNFDIVSAATGNFSFGNKIGEGGFGPVYKGKLLDGQEIAVKRLSKSSTQGLKEFKNEVMLIGKLQHRNLVRLLGCCIQGDEKMLIYEYMPNRSLDSFIFDQRRSHLLDWQRRYDIICGIARGLLYLHQDSRLRIIHRDLKVSNILLDSDMNPKISDFGLARSFGGNHSEANTKRVVGTYGYMSPEYAAGGFFSVKSDVFSFGVIVLEVVSGSKNRGFYHPNHCPNLLGHAWKLWNEDNALGLVDATVKNALIISEALRCIHVALLCVQQRPDDRPDMSHVISMLVSETSNLPQPKHPGFFTEYSFDETNPTSKMQNQCSCNEVTITWLDGR
ncbi:hypothetical protein Scep_013207 [Stephania cephalantha]|uniref:Receptor-like serine/threonine-protein kinase n=1 Tax=Stephania cephalantha TaxID=152367 RepID=A0AAP0JGM2_9MAGN